MLEIYNLVHGEILNHTAGRESATGLEIPVQGWARPQDQVTVNGQLARRNGERFESVINLVQPITEIVVRAQGDRGASSRTIQVVYDRASFPRINFCIDDNIYFLRDLARERPATAFDHFYLKKLQELHDQYGLKLTLNLFFADPESGFTLGDFPECYRAEFQARSDWLRFAFHARSEFPDRPYQNAEVATLLRDFDLVNREIDRFAGTECRIAPANIHWAMVKPDALVELQKRGVRFLGGLFLDGQTRIGEAMSRTPVCDIGYFLNEENSRYLSQHKLWHDFSNNLNFGTEAVVLNLCELAALPGVLSQLLLPERHQALHMLTHEQYFFPEYSSYLPDHFNRLELLCRTAKERGYQFVFFNTGFLGNPTWGD